MWQVGFVAVMVWGIVLLRQFRYPVQLLGYGLDGWVGLLLLSLLLSSGFAPFPPVALWNLSRVLCFLVLLYVGRNCLNDDRFQFRFQFRWKLPFKLRFSPESQSNSEFQSNSQLQPESPSESEPELPSDAQFKLKPWFNIQNLWFSVLVVGLITALISFSLWRPSPEMWLSDEFNDAIRNHLPLGNNNFMGGYAVLLFPLAIFFPLSYGGWRRIFGIVASVVMAALLYSSGSRGALLGAIVIVTLLIGVALVQTKGKQKLMAIVS